MVNRIVNRLFHETPDWLFEVGLEFPEDLDAYLDEAVEKALVNRRRKIAGGAAPFPELA